MLTVCLRLRLRGSPSELSRTITTGETTCKLLGSTKLTTPGRVYVRTGLKERRFAVWQTLFLCLFAFVDYFSFRCHVHPCRAVPVLHAAIMKLGPRLVVPDISKGIGAMGMK